MFKISKYVQFLLSLVGHNSLILFKFSAVICLVCILRLLSDFQACQELVGHNLLFSFNLSGNLSCLNFPNSLRFSSLLGVSQLIFQLLSDCFQVYRVVISKKQGAHVKRGKLYLVSTRTPDVTNSNFAQYIYLAVPYHAPNFRYNPITNR